MLVQCPLNPKSIQALDDLIEAGADEFYFGYRNNLCRDRDRDILNRRFGSDLNFESVDAAAQAADLIRSRQKQAFVVLNEQFFPVDWYPVLVREAQALHDAGARGFVVSDISLLIELARAAPHVFVALSSVAFPMNSAALDFYEQFGVQRFILSRQVTVEEIAALGAARPDAEFEIIVKNEECPFLEGVCGFAHLADCRAGNICMQLVSFNKYPMQGGYVVDACGVCALHALGDVTNLVLKIAGRGCQTHWILDDVRHIRAVLGRLGQGGDAVAFSEFCADKHAAIYGDRCRRKCYYPVDYIAGEEFTGPAKPSDTQGGQVKYCSTLPFPSVE